MWPSAVQLMFCQEAIASGFRFMLQWFRRLVQPPFTSLVKNAMWTQVSVTAAQLGRSNSCSRSKETAAKQASHEERLPFDDLVCCHDFSFAAWSAVQCGQSLRAHRKLGRALLKELAPRRRPLSNHFRKYLPPSVFSVAEHMDVGFLATLVTLICFDWAARNCEFVEHC